MKNRKHSKSAPPAFTPVPRKYRHDGWTPARQHAFIEALADSGSVKHAARAVEMSTEGAYALRRQPGAEAFAAAWEAALDHGIRRLEDIAMDRAINGVKVPVYSYGKLVGTRIVYNDYLVMFMLRNRADKRFAAGASKTRTNWDAERKALRAQWDAEQEAKRDDVIARVRAHMDVVRGRLQARAAGATDGQEPDADTN